MNNVLLFKKPAAQTLWRPPTADLFQHPSTLHGVGHVTRVMVHAERLIAATDQPALAPALWTAVYLHDLRRTHDGLCYRHGRDAAAWFQFGPAREPMSAFFASGGVVEADYPAILTAVTWHSLPDELPTSDPYYQLTALLKDADGLDRVRLGDLDVRYLRHSEAVAMAGFAEALFRKSR